MGKEVDKSLQEFGHAAATEGASMESLEKELYEKLIEKEENKEKYMQELKKRSEQSKEAEKAKVE